MTDQSNNESNTPVAEQPAAGAEALSFSDYEKFRRGELKLDTAPGAKPVQKAAANSEPAETEEEESDELEASPDESEESDKPKKKGGFQRRIDKLNGKLAEERRAREALEARLAGYQPKQDEPRKVETVAQQEGRPSPDAFGTHAEYVEALTDWKIEQRESKSKAEAERSKLMSEQEKIQKAHFERVKSFAEKTEDFQEVLEAVDDIPPSAALVQLLVEAENGPELMYELAKNREEYARIARLSPLAAARAIGQLESKLNSKASESKPEPKKLTSAPKPIDPVGKGTGKVAKSLTDPDISFADYERLRRAQMKRR